MKNRPISITFSRLFILIVVAVISIRAAGFQAHATKADDDFQKQRLAMVRDQIADRGIKNKNVIEAMTAVPRHKFIPESYLTRAYEDGPLPIGYGQTISQPYIVAYMTEVLNLHKNARVLEVGTGSGYQAAVLSLIVRQVYTIEIIPELAKSAALRLKDLGYRNIEVAVGDGYYGWNKYAHFDAIIVTAAAGHIPPPLIQQLKNTGSMVIPVGGSFLTQNLILVTKDKDGKVTTKNLMPVRFVPLTGGQN